MTLGFRVIQTIGPDIAERAPTPGFVADCAVAATMLPGSPIGLSISPPHTLAGAVIGVGSPCEIAAIDAGIIREIVLSCIAPVPFKDGSAAVLFVISRVMALGGPTRAVRGTGRRSPRRRPQARR